MVDALAQHDGQGLAECDATTYAVPWGIAHMRYIEKSLLRHGFEEDDVPPRPHTLCTWGTLVSLHLLIWSWWWVLHAVVDTWLFWWREGRVAIRMPMWWLWGATLHIGHAPQRNRSSPEVEQHQTVLGVRSLIPPEGALEKWWKGS